MQNADIRAILTANADEKYRCFSARLLPPQTPLLGVRLPFLRQLARQIVRRGEWKEFWRHAELFYLEEKMLRGFVCAYAPVVSEERFEMTADFVPVIDNWSVCDSFCASFKFEDKDKEALWLFLQPYFGADGEYGRRFAVVMALMHLNSDVFAERLLAELQGMKADEYYVQMAVAWALSVMYISCPDMVENLLARFCLRPEIQNMTVRKIRESLRVNEKQKQRLLTFKVKL